METTWFEHYVRQSLPKEHHHHLLVPALTDIALKIANLCGVTKHADSGEFETKPLQLVAVRFEQALNRILRQYQPLRERKLGGFPYPLNKSFENKTDLKVGTDAINDREFSLDVYDALLNLSGNNFDSCGVFSRGSSDIVHDQWSVELGYESENNSQDNPCRLNIKQLFELCSLSLEKGSCFQIIVDELYDSVKLVKIELGVDEDFMLNLHQVLMHVLNEMEMSAISDEADEYLTFDVEPDSDFSEESMYPIDENQHEGTASLIFNNQYPSEIGKLIENAKCSIRLALCYLVPGSAGVNDLVEKLIAAKERGVSVKVILHREAQDLYSAQDINQAGFDLLEEHGIDVYYDINSNLIYSKVLVVDKEISVIGSHNWTAGSFYAFEDVSIAVQSESVASAWADWCDAIKIIWPINTE